MDTSKLTKAQKIELIKLLEEKERRERARKPVYKPHSGQIDVHKSTAKIRFVTSGNGFGKSTLAVQEAFWWAKGYNPITKQTTPVPARVGVLMDRPSKFTDVFLQEARKWFDIPSENCHKRGKPHLSEISFDNGSVIVFFSHDQDPLTFESIQLDYVVADEPFPREIYVGLRRSMRRKGFDSKMIIIGTPIGQPWLKEQLWDPWERGENPEVECFRGSTHANERNLADDYIKSFSSVLSDAEKQVRLHGGWFNAGGLALAHLLDRKIHVVDTSNWDQNNPCVIAIDCHVSKPHTAVLLGIDRDGYMYVLDEFQSKLIARDFAKQMIAREWFTKYKILDCVYDSLGQTETSSGEGFKSFGVVFNEVMSQHRLGRARPTTFEDKNEEEFISRIQDSLAIPEEPNLAGQRVPKLRFSTKVERTYRETENVQWEKTRGMDEFKPKLAIGNKDFMAALKYALATNLYYKKTKDKVFYHKKQAYGFDLTPKTRGKMNIRRPRNR